jgi:hypothetical protein
MTPRQLPTVDVRNLVAVGQCGHSGRTFAGDVTATGTLNADGSFSASGQGLTIMRGVFATGGGRTVIRDGVMQFPICSGTFEATKQ